MTTILYPETTTQFLARMLLATREQHQIARTDAQRLSDLANFGTRGQVTTMPEERRDASKPLQPTTQNDLVA